MKLNFKVLALIFITMMAFTVSQAQQVDFNDLMKGKSETEVNSSKKWIKDLTDAKDINVAKQVVSSELVKMTKSKHWYSLTAEGEITSELSFQTTKKMHVDRVIENLKEAGFELVNTKCTTDCKTFIYSRSTLTIEVIALETENTAQTVYLVSLL